MYERVQGEGKEDTINLTCRETATVVVLRRVERGRSTIICSKMGPHLFWGALIKVDLSIKSVGYVRKSILCEISSRGSARPINNLPKG